MTHQDAIDIIYVLKSIDNAIRDGVVIGLTVWIFVTIIKGLWESQ